MDQELLNLGYAEFPRVSPAMKTDVPANPFRVGLLRPVRQTPSAHAFPCYRKEPATLPLHTTYLTSFRHDLSPQCP